MRASVLTLSALVGLVAFTFFAERVSGQETLPPTGEESRAASFKITDEFGADWVDAFGSPSPWRTVKGSGWNVILALGTECPLARLYTTRLEQLAATEEFAEVRWVLVSVMPQDGPLDLQRFRTDLGTTLSLVKDVSGSLAQHLELERVPTAILISPEGEVVYRGRVDDQYEVGARRQSATRSELVLALNSALSGKPIEQPFTEAPGCLIPQPITLSSQPTVTFSKDVAPILDRLCVRCHRPDDIGPMALIDAEEVAGWGEMILEVVDDGRMPPWHAADPAGTFQNENRISDQERQTLATWIDEGKPLGSPQDRPPLPTFASSWRSEVPPDAIIELPGEGFRVPAEGTVEYQYFVVDPGWTEDRWLRGAQLLPGHDSVVHHAIVFLRSPVADRFDGLGWVAAYVPGQEPIRYEPGMARRIPAGSKLIFQMHYTPDGAARVDRSRLGLWFADEASVTREVLTAMLVNSTFEIPAQASQHAVTATLDRWPAGTELLALAPHMHVRGKSIEVKFQSSDGTSRTLLQVPRYDFGWQHTYRLANSMPLEPNAKIEFRAVFDNSPANLFNPDPNRSVRWGEQTWQEMAVVFLDLSVPRGALESTESESVTSQPDAERVAQFFQKFDADGNQLIERSEVPETFAAFAFSRLDLNEDGQLDAVELATEFRR